MSDWRLAARCRGMDTDLFYRRDEEGHGARIRRERRATRICHTCMVRSQCRDHAVATGEDHGVWGATSETERRQMLKAMGSDRA
nr:WhiB family transcriptional regulator [Rhodococcus opacus]